MIRILAASAGMLAVSRLSTLPTFFQATWALVLALLALAIIAAWKRPVRCFACFCLGVAWGLAAGHYLLSQQLPMDVEGEEFLISGYLSDLPENRGEFQRVEFTIDDYHNLNPDYARKQVMPKRVLLSWYGQRDLRVAQHWTLRVKLSRPRGFVNSGGFDYQRWLLSRRLGATGYVRPSTHNELHGTVSGLPVQKRREAVRDWISGAFDQQTASLLLALAVGDSSGLSPEQWGLLRSTGTSHLMAISGLHVGFVALMGFWLGHGMRAALSLLRLRLSYAYWLPGFISCLLAGVYSAMAGFALPTQRALTMVVLVNLALVAGRVGSSMRALAWAMLLVLLIDPLSGYDLGFWLSFGAVAFLLFHFQSRFRPGLVDSDNAVARRQFFPGRIATFLRAQWVVFVGLAVPLLALNQQISLLAPLANLIAIPLVSFLVVAPLLTGLSLHALGIGGAGSLLQLAATMLSLCMGILDGLAGMLHNAGWYPAGAALHWSMLLVAGAGVLLLLGPRGLPARWLGVLLVAPLLFPAGATRPPLRVTALDVGQGLAVVVATENRVLVYDTGAAFSERFNAGDAVIGPYLRAQGVQHIDRMIISHDDLDHAGGAVALLGELSTQEVIGGEKLPAVNRAFPAVPVSRCDRDSQWEWDEVSFRLIEPAGRTKREGNDASCVLLVDYAGQQILIPGDIEEKVERDLLLHEQLPEAVALVVAPHHGSATSSTEGFVARLRPQHVIYSAGYRSRYGHPHPRVQARYRAAGSQAYNTAELGQVDFTWDRRGNLHVAGLRQSERRYWFDF